MAYYSKAETSWLGLKHTNARALNTPPFPADCVQRDPSIFSRQEQVGSQSS